MTEVVDESRVSALKQNVFDALKGFQDALRTYQTTTGSPPTFLIDGQAGEIPADLLAHCRLVPRREDIISSLPKGGIGAEVGTQTGRFARTLVDLAQPSKLFLLDIDYTPFQRDFVEQELKSGVVETLEGQSWDLLGRFEDEYFDFIYVDAGHGYDMVKRDMEMSVRKVKRGGMIICNDFVIWSALEAIPYGVFTAVTETIIEHKLLVTHIGLHPFGYNDIALLRR